MKLFVSGPVSKFTHVLNIVKVSLAFLVITGLGSKYMGNKLNCKELKIFLEEASEPQSSY